MYCPACGEKNPDDARFCGSCSERLEAPVVETPADDDTAAIDVGDSTETVSNGLKYGILGASLLIPLIGLVMGMLYLLRGETEDKKATGKLWLIASGIIVLLYMLTAGGGF